MYAFEKMDEERRRGEARERLRSRYGEFDEMKEKRKLVFLEKVPSKRRKTVHIPQCTFAVFLVSSPPSGLTSLALQLL